MEVKVFKILLAISFLTNLGVQASQDRVGDSILLKGMYQGMPMELEAKYLRFEAGVMVQKQVTKLNGAVINDEETPLPEDEVLTPENAGLIVAMCESIGGVHESLNLPVGTTLTCKIDSQSLINLPAPFSLNFESLGSTVWVGPFPVLGIAQFLLDGNLMVIQKYRWN